LAPALFPLVLLLVLFKWPSRPKAAFTLFCFAFSYGAFAGINRAYLRNAAPWRLSWLVPLIQALFPLQLTAALLSPQRLTWRGHTIQVERGGGFHFVEKRNVQ